jgi:hypothetical protein
MGSSDLVEPDFGSLTGGVHHMRDPLVNESKSGKVRVRKVRGSGSADEAPGVLISPNGDVSNHAVIQLVGLCLTYLLSKSTLRMDQNMPSSLPVKCK